MCKTSTYLFIEVFDEVFMNGVYKLIKKYTSRYFNINYHLAGPALRGEGGSMTLSLGPSSRGPGPGRKNIGAQSYCPFSIFLDDFSVTLKIN